MIDWQTEIITLTEDVSPFVTAHWQNAGVRRVMHRGVEIKMSREARTDFANWLYDYRREEFITDTTRLDGYDFISPKQISVKLYKGESRSSGFDSKREKSHKLGEIWGEA